MYYIIVVEGVARELFIAKLRFLLNPKTRMIYGCDSLKGRPRL